MSYKTNPGTPGRFFQPRSNKRSKSPDSVKSGFLFMRMRLAALRAVLVGIGVIRRGALQTRATLLSVATVIALG